MRIIEFGNDSSGKKISLEEMAHDYYNCTLPGSRWEFEDRLIAIENLARRFKTPTRQKIINYIVNNFKKIITAPPKKLHSYARKFDKEGFTEQFYDKGKITNFGTAMLEAFSYETFRKSKKAAWYGKSLNVKACVYCNAAFAITIRKGASVKMLFQFDHFYSKNKYPFLSLSMFNLIPSCSTCNLAKSRIDFTIKNAIHPYLEDMNLAFNFIPDQADAIKYFTRRKSSKIRLDLEINNKKLGLHNRTFGLKEIYDCHIDLVEEIFLRSYYYNSSKRKEIHKMFGGSVDEGLINRFILGNYYLDEDINKRPLSKLTKDIAKRIKLI